MLALAAKTAEAMRTTTDQWGPCVNVKRSPRQGAALVVAVKARDVMKVHHVLADPEEETREVPLDPEKETREVPLDPKGGDTLDTEEETRDVPLDPKEGTQETPLDPAEKTREAPSDREDEARGTPSDPGEEALEAPSYPDTGGAIRFRGNKICSRAYKTADRFGRVGRTRASEAHLQQQSSAK